jgi:hypothetical protein
MLVTTDYNCADSGLVATNRVFCRSRIPRDNASTELNYRPARWVNGGGWAGNAGTASSATPTSPWSITGKAYADLN